MYFQPLCQSGIFTDLANTTGVMDRAGPMAEGEDLRRLAVGGDILIAGHLLLCQSH